MEKVQFNISNVHYAKMTPAETPSAAPTYAAPIHVPGAVNLSLDQSGDVEEFYADGIRYYVSQTNNGYSGDLEMALFPQQMLVDIWNFVLEATDKVLLEYSTGEPAAFALLFQIDNDETNSRFCLYNCKGTKPGISSTTNTTTKTPQTQTSTITASPREDNHLIAARTTSSTSAQIKAAWFDAVYSPPAAEDDPEGAEEG